MSSGPQVQAVPVLVPPVQRNNLSGTSQGRTLGRSATAAARVHERLREDILSLALPPGSSLSENDLARSFGVSRTPVREALLRLSDENLVEIVPKSGTTVSRIPYAKLGEAIVIRRALEEVAVRKAAERASKSQITGLHAIIERQREAELANDAEAFHNADEALHAAIAEAAGYPGIWVLVRQVKFHVDRFRRLTLPQVGRIARVIEEHEAVVDAIARHDGEAALRAMDHHLDGRSEERRVGKECRRLCRSRWSPYH
jgi:DNA-binding GntR family transcriptional regulator